MAPYEIVQCTVHRNTNLRNDNLLPSSAGNLKTHLMPEGTMLSRPFEVVLYFCSLLTQKAYMNKEMSNSFKFHYDMEKLLPSECRPTYEKHREG